MVTLNYSITESLFDGLCDFRENNNLLIEAEDGLLKHTQLVAKKVTLEFGYALLAIIGAIESIGRLALAASLGIGVHFFESRDVRQMLQETIEGLISSIHATAYSILALYVNLFGDDHLELRAEVQRVGYIMREISGHITRLYFR